jgi:Arc/MetJ-type ribon-helix-helix transcriptional regulator
VPTFEVTLPDRIESEIDRLAEQDEFLNREQAIEELLSRGLSAYNQTPDSSTDDMYDDAFSQSLDDQQDPAMRDDREGDPRSF